MLKELAYKDQRVVLALMVEGVDIIALTFVPELKNPVGFLVINTLQYWMLQAYLYNEERDAGFALETIVEIFGRAWNPLLPFFFPGYAIAVLVREYFPSARPVLSTIGGFTSFIRSIAVKTVKKVLK